LYIFYFENIYKLAFHVDSGLEMSSKWREIAEKVLEHEDRIQKTYPGKLDGKNGYLMMSNRKLLFVRQEGFMHKTYDITMDLPYKKIGKINPNGKYELEITDVDSVKHSFKTEELNITIVEKSLEELKSPSK
jgi:hypothetical protein